MPLSDKELEERLTSVGESLLQPPSTADELLNLLDQIEEILSKVEQSPPKSMQTSLSTLMKALMVEELMHHSDVDIKVGIASCISEITRITAPDAPYDDDKMKDVFQLIVSSFENLSDVSSRCHGKRLAILETMAKIRSCVIMLDLECEQMVIDMFQHFLKGIRVDHADVVFTSMETIMMLVLEESEDISPNLLNPILSALKKNDEDVLPIAKKLAEKVIQNFGDKLQPYLTQALKSLDASPDDYSEVVSSMCQENTGTDGHDTESSLKDQLVSEDGAEKTISNDGGPTSVGSPKLFESNAIPVIEETVTRANSSEVIDSSHQRNGTSMSNTVSDDCGAKKSVDSRSGHAEAQQVSCSGDTPSDNVHISATEIKLVEAANSVDEVKETDIHLSLTKSPEHEALHLASPTQSSSLHNESESNKDSIEKRKEMLVRKELVSLDTASEKASDGVRIPEAKKQRRPGKEQTDESTKGKTLTDKDASKNEEGNTNDLDQTGKPGDGSEKIEDASSSRKIDGKKSGRGKPITKGKVLTDKGTSKIDEATINDSEARPLNQTEKPGDASDKIVDASSSGKIDGKDSGCAKPTANGKTLTEEGASKNNEGSKNDSDSRPLIHTDELRDASDNFDDTLSSGKTDGKMSECAKPTTKVKTLTDKDASKNDKATTNDSDARPLNQTDEIGDASDKVEDASSLGKMDGKKSEHAKSTTEVKTLTDKGASKNDEASINDSDARPLNQTDEIGDASDKVEDASSLGKMDGKKSEHAKPTTEVKTLTDEVASKNDEASINDSDAWSLNQADELGNVSDKVEDASLSGKMDGKKNGHEKPTTKGKKLTDKGSSKNDEASTNDSDARLLNQTDKLGDASDKVEDASSSGKMDGKKSGHAKLTIKGKTLNDKVASKNDEGSTNDSEARPLAQTAKLGETDDKTDDRIEDASLPGKIDGKKGGRVKPTTKGKALSDKSASNNDEGSTNDSQSRSSNQTEKLGGVGDKIANASSPGKKSGRGKPTEKTIQKSPASENHDKDTEMSPKLPLKSMKGESIQEETPGRGTKRKQTPGTGKASGTIEYGENLIGSKVKVWWPKDRMFYEGVVASFDAAKKKHKVMYIDGDEEILFLKKERWEFVKDEVVSDEDQDDEQSSHEASFDVQKKKKGNTNPGSSAKRRKVEGSPKSKLKGVTKSSGKLKSDGKAESESKDNNSSKTGRKSADDTIRSKDHSPKLGEKLASMKVNAKSKDDIVSTSGLLKQDSQKTAKSKPKTPQSGKTLGASSTKLTKSGSLKGKGTDWVKERMEDSGKSSETAKRQDMDSPKLTKSGKKRRR